jgi:peptidoglycan hydrolase CwlO-like protein
VLGQAQTPRRRLLGIAAVALVILVVPAVGGADPTNTADALRQENADLAARSRATVLSVYALDSRLGATRARLASLRAQAERLRAERVSLARQLRVARNGMTISQRRLAARLRALYEQNDVSAMEILLGSRTLDDALTRLDNVNRFAELDKSVVTEVKTAKRKLTSSSRALAERAAHLAAAAHEAEAVNVSLQRQKAEREAYIARLATQRQLNEQQIARVEALARAAQARTQELAAPTASEIEPAVAADDAATPAPGAAPQASVAAGARAPAISVTVTGYAPAASPPAGAWPRSTPA